MRALRLLCVTPSLMLVWLVCMGSLCPNGGVTPSDCDPPAFVTETLRAGTLGEAYDDFIGFSTDDEVTPEVRVTSGALPPGLSFTVDDDDEEVDLRGTPTTLGTFAFTLDLVDNCGLDTRSFSIVIEPRCPALTYTSSSLPQGSVDLEYAAAFPLSGGLRPVSVTVIAGDLPPGIIVALDTLQGTPTTAGTYTFTAVASDSCSPAQTVSREFTVIINEEGTCPALELAATPFPNGEVDEAYNQSIPAIGGVAPLTVTLASGSLPTGISIVGDPPRISGTPTAAGTFAFTLRVTDSCSPPQVVEQAYSIIIDEAAGCADAPALYLPPPPAGQVGVDYPDYMAIVSFGEPPLTFSHTGGQLPDGLFLVNVNGEIVGQPLAVGTFNFEITVTDSCVPPRTASAEASITITDPVSCNPLSLNPLTLEAGTVGIPYEHFFGEWTNGGEGDLSFFSQAPSNPPPGLTLDQVTGTLSGTPTTAGVHQFVLMVTDQCDPPQQEFELITITIN